MVAHWRNLLTFPSLASTCACGIYGHYFGRKICESYMEEFQNIRTAATLRFCAATLSSSVVVETGALKRLDFPFPPCLCLSDASCSAGLTGANLDIGYLYRCHKPLDANLELEPLTWINVILHVLFAPSCYSYPVSPKHCFVFAVVSL
jgi:hypothetical protein